MSPYACLVTAAIVLAALPPQAFGHRGLRSLGGLAPYLGYSALAAAPGTVLAVTAPAEGLAALALAVAGAVLVGSVALATRIRLGARRKRAADPWPARSPQAAPIEPNTPISPWMLQGIIAGSKPSRSPPAPPTLTPPRR